MQESTTERGRVVEFRQQIRSLLETKIVEAVETVLDEELQQSLGSGWYETPAPRFALEESA